MNVAPRSVSTPTELPLDPLPRRSRHAGPSGSSRPSLLVLLQLGGKPMPHRERRPGPGQIVHRIHIEVASQVTFWTLVQSSRIVRVMSPTASMTGTCSFFTLHVFFFRVFRQFRGSLSSPLCRTSRYPRTANPRAFGKSFPTAARLHASSTASALPDRNSRSSAWRQALMQHMNKVESSRLRLTGIRLMGRPRFTRPERVQVHAPRHEI